MSGWRLAPLFFATVLVFLQGGDCVSPLLADQQANDCCTKGQCNPVQKSDPCCHPVSPSFVKSFPSKDKVSVTPVLAPAADAVLAFQRFHAPYPALLRQPLKFSVDWPPGVLSGLSFPLLI